MLIWYAIAFLLFMVCLLIWAVTRLEDEVNKLKDSPPKRVVRSRTGRDTYGPR